MEFIINLFVLALFCELISCSGHVTIFGSERLIRNGKYSAAITWANFSDSPTLEVAIHSENGIWRMDKNITLTSGESQSESVEFDMKDQPLGDYTLSVKSSAFNLNQSKKLNMMARNVLVQTDKAIYKPSDTVQFRVLFLDFFEPLDATSAQVYIIDGAQNRIKQFDEIVFIKGLFHGNFLLSDSPILGHWQIVVLVDNRKTEKEFEVAEYTLPTFGVRLDVNPHVSFDEKIIRATVTVEYSFGKMVKGIAKVTAEWEQSKKSKIIEVNGSNSVEFHMSNELAMNEITTDRTIKLFVTFTEDQTGAVQNATASVQVHSVPYKIFVKTKPTKFKRGLSLTVEAIVQFHAMNIPVTDYKNPAIITVVLSEEKNIVYINRRPVYTGGASHEQNYTIYPINGISKVDIPIPKNIYKVKVTARYLQAETTETIPEAMPIRSESITITSKTQTPRRNENVTINIQSTKELTEFTYHVLNMDGRAVVSRTVQVLATTDHDFVITPMHEMGVEIKVTVFYRTDCEIISDSLHLEFVELRNFVHIETSRSETFPGHDIEINVTSSPNSCVYVAAIDQSVLLLKGGNDIGEYFDKLKEKIQSSDVFYITYPALHCHGSMSGASPGGEYKSPETTFRQNFIESWLFESVHLGVNQTSEVISWTVPDTITTWIITAFSINPVTGFALTGKPTKLSVFQPFFITMDLPLSIKRNEIVSIPISVRNYLNRTQYVKITLNIEKTEIIDGRTQTKVVNAQSAESVTFRIRASELGSKNITVAAETGSYSDGITRNLLVLPEGITQHKNEVVFVDLRENRNFATDINIDIPECAVLDSIKIEASLIGDILGLPIGNVHKLLYLPDGCGEQNMINFVPNVVVLDYLTAVSSVTPESRRIARQHLETGYQKQLTFRHDDGSFSIWGKDDESGCTWLTAFVAKYFHQAAKYIAIDKKIIEKALGFLSQTQSKDGRFQEVGYIFQKDIQGGSSNEIALTAYTLITFLENTDFADTYKVATDRALAFLSKNYFRITDKYSLAIVTYAFQLVDHPLKSVSLSRLEARAVKEADTMNWKQTVFESHDSSDATSLDIETTAYALLAFVEAGRLTDSARIMKWLVSQRNEKGGFISTQDTVVGLQALSKVAAKMYSANTNLNVAVQYNNKELSMLYVNERNALIFQKYELPSSARDFQIAAAGQGFSIFQISYQYNTLSEKMYKFNISRVVVGFTAVPNTFRLDVCVNYIPDEKTVKSHMAVMEVNFPSGCTFKTDSEKDLRSTKEIKKVENYKTSVIVYFDDLSATHICPQFIFSADQVVKRLQPALIHVYDYYNIKQQAQRFYELPSK